MRELKTAAEMRKITDRVAEERLTLVKDQLIGMIEESATSPTTQGCVGWRMNGTNDSSIRTWLEDLEYSVTEEDDVYCISW